MNDACTKRGMVAMSQCFHCCCCYCEVQAFTEIARLVVAREAREGGPASKPRDKEVVKLQPKDGGKKDGGCSC